MSSFGNDKWRALSYESRGERIPRRRGRGRGWLAVATASTDNRGPVANYRQLIARRVADATTADDSIQRLLALFWASVACMECGGTGPCAHRNRAADLADIQAERKW